MKTKEYWLAERNLSRGSLTPILGDFWYLLVNKRNGVWYTLINTNDYTLDSIKNILVNQILQILKAHGVSLIVIK